jgi:hypothetical protein
MKRKLFFVLCVMAILLVFGAVKQACALVILKSEVWSAPGGNFHQYLVVQFDGWNTNGPIDWNTANSLVGTLGDYHLATITTVEEQTWIASTLMSGIQYEYWIGAYQDPINTQQANANWKWVTGEPWSFTAWGPNEPSDYWGPGSEQWAAIWDVYNWGWNDEQSNSRNNIRGFIAESTNPVSPIANAGPNQTVHEGSLVPLDGSGSSDPSGLVPLTYDWSFSSKPAGSAAALSNPASVNPTFTADQPGNYVIQLIVTDTAGLASAPSSVTISTTNSPPVASAAASPQAVTLIGSTIQLDGSQSYDPDGDPITYQWSLVSPPGSLAKLSDSTIVNPTFIADVHGTYVAQLIVSDPWIQSTPATVTISSLNLKPVANAGTSQSAIVGDTVTLNGSGSSDADGDPLTYQWSFTSVPAGSLSGIASPTSKETTFVPDLPGSYVAQLIVNDGIVNSDPSTVQVQVVTAQTAAVQQTQSIQTTISTLDTSVLKNTTMQNALTNKLNAVLANIEAGNYASALDQLQNDILGKTDGCATTGVPDKNDWIKTCDAQNQVYPYVVNLIKFVQSIK